MLKLFLGRNVLFQLLVLLFLSVLLLATQWGLLAIPPHGFSPLYDAIYHIISPYPLVVQITSAIMLMVLIVGVSLVLQFYDLSQRQSFVGSLMMLMLMLAFPKIVMFGPLLIASVLFLFIMKLVFDLEVSESKEKTLFGIAVLSGISSLVYFPSAMLLVFLLLTLIYMQLLTFRYVLFILVHFALPYFLLFAISYYQDTHLAYIDSMKEMFSLHAFMETLTLNVVDKLKWLVLAFLIVFVSFKHLGGLMTQLIQIRRYSMVIFWGLILTVLSLLWVPNMQEYFFLSVFLPLSMLMAFVLKDVKKFRFYNILIAVVMFAEVLYILSMEFHVIA